MLEIQSDSDDSSSDEENQDIMNLCLMAQDEEVTSEPSVDFIFEKLQDDFQELLNDFRKISTKYKDLKNKNTLLTKEKDEVL